MSTPIPHVNVRELVARTLIVKHLADVANTAVKQHRRALEEEMVSGDRLSVAGIGKIWRTEPSGTARIADRQAFTAWMAEHYPDQVLVETRIAPGWESDAITVLEQHAPRLLRKATTVCDWAESTVLKLSEQARQPCGPGGETDVPGVAYEPPGPGVVTVKLGDAAPAEIERLWREGRIQLQAGEILALPE